MAADLVKGALAGAVATWVMGQVTTRLYEQESEEVRDRENRARNGKTAYGVAAEQAAAVADSELSEQERKQAGRRFTGSWASGQAPPMV